MASEEASDIVVIGGGVIGVAAALTLQCAGYRVLLVDRDAPGKGCSYGNAGVIAASFVLPLSSAGHLLAAPGMLLDPLGPLAIRVRDVPAITPWLTRFLRNAAPARQRRTIEGLKQLNREALRAWCALLDLVGARHLLVERGMLDVARDARGRDALHKEARRLRAEGVALAELSADEIAEVEPLLRGRARAAMFHPEVAHVDDPYRVTQALLAGFGARGGRVARARVRGLEPFDGGVRIETDGAAIAARRVLVAAGYGSKPLLRGLGLPVPIGVEHGYHLHLPAPGVAPSRPIAFHAESFLATPMAGGLRLAGTVELARAEAPPNWARSDRLLTLARTYFPGLDGTGARRWRGGRPSFADSLPAIGQVPGAPQIVYAFGHQHLGLTLAAITGQCVLSLVAGRAPPLALDGLSLARFGRARGTSRTYDVGEVAHDFPQ